MTGDETDPIRWAARTDGPAIEDQVGADIRKMGRPDLPDDHALARIQQRVVVPAARRRGAFARFALVAGIPLVFAGGVVSAQLGGFPFRRENPSVVSELSVPKGSTARLRGKRRRQIAVVGPAEVSVGNGGDADAVALGDGLIVVEAGEQPVAVSAGGVTVSVPAGAAGAVSATGAGAPEAIALAGALTVTSSRGTTALGERQLWREGATASAPPDRLEGAARALSGETRVETPLPAPPAAMLPAPPPAIVAPPVRPPPARRLRSAAAVVAIAEPRTASAPVPPPVEPTTPPPLPAPALPQRRALSLPLLAPSPPVGAGVAADGELALITTAVRKLRTDDDPRGALAALDQHRARFPAGALGREATLARVEALLALGRRGDALGVLDDAAVGDLPRARTVRATRGELRAELGRCADAIKDFDLLLATGPRDAYAERALYGRAVCRLRDGQAAHARADLDLYRATYPRGRFAADVQRLLENR